MTQLRTPCTWADAMTRVAGVIGWAECERIAGRCNRLVRAWSEPNSGKYPRVDIACACDAAYRAAGGEGSPFLEAFAHLSEQALSQTLRDHMALTQEAATAAREAGEAIAATLQAAQPGAGPREAHRALVETQQAETAFGAIRRRLSSFLPFGTAPGAGNTGGTHQ